MDTIVTLKQDSASQHLGHYATNWPHVHWKRSTIKTQLLNIPNNSKQLVLSGILYLDYLFQPLLHGY